MNWVPHFFSPYDCLFYCTMYDSCPFLYSSWQIMMWLYIVPYLYMKTKCLHSLPLPKSFTLTFSVRESELLQKHHEGVQMGTVSNSLSSELFYICMKDQFWMVFESEGERAAVISLHPFFLTHESVIHLPSDAWLYLLLRNSLHLKKGVFCSSAWNGLFHFPDFFRRRVPILFVL